MPKREARISIVSVREPSLHRSRKHTQAAMPASADGERTRDRFSEADPGVPSRQVVEIAWSVILPRVLRAGPERGFAVREISNGVNAEAGLPDCLQHQLLCLVLLAVVEPG